MIWRSPTTSTPTTARAATSITWRPIATTSGLTYTVGPLAAPSDNTFAVRAFDTISGIEEANTDARVRIILDAAGNDVTARPNSVVGLSATADGGGDLLGELGLRHDGAGGATLDFQRHLGGRTHALTREPPSPRLSICRGWPDTGAPSRD